MHVRYARSLICCLLVAAIGGNVSMRVPVAPDTKLICGIALCGKHKKLYTNTKPMPAVKVSYFFFFCFINSSNINFWMLSDDRKKKHAAERSEKKVFVLEVNILDILTRVCPDIAPYFNVVVSKFFFFGCLLNIIFSCRAKKKARMQIQTRV